MNPRRRPMSTLLLLWNLSTFELPGVSGDGMSARNEQQKPGTARGWPRHSRTAKAVSISREVKSHCAREWGAWGRISDDGPGHYNLVRSEDPWGRRRTPPHGGAVIASTDPTLGGSMGSTKGKDKPDVGRRMPGAGLS